jgi:molybdenum cofactor synthesis domain-containing protein
MTDTPTAALVIIGNEVLSAKVVDENGPWAARRLRELGVKLLAVHVVADVVEEIAPAIQAEHRRATWVFTSGGVGPTHDDVTPRAVAVAIGREVRRHAALAEALRALHQRHHGGAEPSEAALRMADVPEGTVLLGDAGYPTLAVENVLMLPGVPSFFRFQFDRVAHLLAAPPFRLVNLFLSADEDAITSALDAVVAAHPGVEIGSYPRFDEGADHRLKLTVESKDEGRVRAAVAALLAALPAGVVLRTEGP